MSKIPTTTQSPRQREAMIHLRRKQQEHERLAFRAYRDGDMRKRERHLCAAKMYWDAARQHVTHIPPASIEWNRWEEQRVEFMQSRKSSAGAYWNARIIAETGGAA